MAASELTLRRICATCVLWRAASQDANANTGQCFRDPPRSATGERNAPVTARTDFCGGHIDDAEDTRGFAQAGGRA
jgi:hypothetical protein